MRRRAPSCQLSPQAPWLPERCVTRRVLVAAELLLQPLPPTHDLDVGALSGPARVSGLGGGAVFCPACRAEHSGGEAVRGARGATAHAHPLATVVARGLHADTAMAGDVRPLHAPGVGPGAAGRVARAL